VPLIFIAGGARSGKSRTALGMAAVRGKQPLLIVTSAEPDEEIREAVSSGESGTGHHMDTVTEPVDLASLLHASSQRYDVLLIDSLTVWLGNLMQQDAEAFPARVEELLATLGAMSATVIAVATEVGCGIEPETELARRFRDEAGRLSQRCAAIADETYWMVFGCPLRVK
jgi:adenosylcobinamide kinase/adenosylcobinamide-phosphate guanylyltransferase